MNLASIQARLESELVAKDADQRVYTQSGSTLATVAMRIEEIHKMFAAGSEVLPYGAEEDREQAELWQRAKAVAEREVRYWLGVYTDAAPKMMDARDRLFSRQRTIDALQEEIAPHLEHLGSRAAKQAREATGNPPGASPSMDTKS